MFLRIDHLTRYEYSEPVAFAPHALYLRPRESPRQRLHEFALTVTPAARRIATDDPLDNALDWAFFPPEPRSSTLEVRSTLLVETLDANPFDFFLSPGALNFPFGYDAAERTALAPCLAPRADSPPAPELRRWLDRHLPHPPAETVSFLTALNSATGRALRYGRREEPGIQSAAETLACGSGTCRDYAVFLIELCRALGLAARFVSGYVYEAPDPGAPRPVQPDMHAWAEVYLPGAGWRGVDPTRGILCDDTYVPVAHTATAESVNPIQGTFYAARPVTSQLTHRLMIEKL
jgi:transglutaminase-like putative cysteine protease